VRTRSAVLAAVLLLAACRRGDDPDHRRYLEARRAYGAVLARTQDESCPEEPACADLVAALRAIPAGHPDAAPAQAVIARIERARAERQEVPAFLGGEPKLPAPDEVPGFLQERVGRPDAGAPDRAGEPPVEVGAAAAPDSGPLAARPDGADLPGSDSLAARPDGADLPGSDPLAARPDGADRTGAWRDGAGADDASTTVVVLDGGGGEPAGAPAAAGAATKDGATSPGPGGPAPANAAGAGGALDPCAALREQLAQRKDWLARTAAERNTIAHVTDPADHAALLQLRRMQRCEVRPDDPDCRAPPVEADVGDLAVDLRDVTREPDDLVAEEGTNPDDLPHDPVVYDLAARLRRCDAGR
jgi:hypothetical protein